MLKPQDGLSITVLVKVLVSRKTGKVPLADSLFRLARLNVVAGATDASRAMLLTSCRKVEFLTAIFGFLWFS